VKCTSVCLPTDPHNTQIRPALKFSVFVSDYSEEGHRNLQKGIVQSHKGFSLFIFVPPLVAPILCKLPFTSKERVKMEDNA